MSCLGSLRFGKFCAEFSISSTSLALSLYGVMVCGVVDKFGSTSDCLEGASLLQHFGDRLPTSQADKLSFVIHEPLYSMIRQ